jgi:hypothetical protein
MVGLHGYSLIHSKIRFFPKLKNGFPFKEKNQVWERFPQRGLKEITKDAGP